MRGQKQLIDYSDSLPISWLYQSAHCPACHKYIIDFGLKYPSGGMKKEWWRVYPVGANCGPVSVEVPAEIAQDYIEACNVLPISAKASAALSRRCLQHILRSNGYKLKTLAQEIDLLLKEPDPKKALPFKIRETIDGIRNFGNFAAHPDENKTTLEVIDVEPHEAEWCLEIIEDLFEHFYVGPAAAISKKAALNAKLAAAGKQPAK